MVLIKIEFCFTLLTNCEAGTLVSILFQGQEYKQALKEHSCALTYVSLAEP